MDLVKIRRCGLDSSGLRKISVAELYEHDKGTLGFTKGGIYGLIWRVLASQEWLCSIVLKFHISKNVDFGTRNIKVSLSAYCYLMEGSPGIIQHECNIMKSPIREEFLILIGCWYQSKAFML
jgi:hypothetical protein